ncbi:fibrinogen-like YCDxxxxGGGW domain-containing protein [Rothia mucilaginosa]|uniref:fibrinogen-like YCDxxxxGGGW domain-containing protein n=1 Tax=Rothia mucilaginosa TaxID=43675 RepID=UPI003C7987CD
MTTTYTNKPTEKPHVRSWSAKKWAAFALAFGTAFTAAPLTPTTPASAVTGTHDGSSSDKAAASCYEVKQVNPSTSSGTYWLYTPQMSGPAQFYCDQETDGGGWVMIGRGREGWTESYNGTGDPNQLHQNPTGPSAFTPVQLPANTVDALLNGIKPQDLPDGMRLHRAHNARGTQWQNVYVQRPQTEQWTWAMSYGQRWGTVKFTGAGINRTAHMGRHASEMAPGITTSSVRFFANPNQGYQIGFAYGALVNFGNENPDSYIYQKRGSAGYSIPFTQVFLRPKLTQRDLNFSQIGSGSAASNRRALPNSYTMPVRWRTSEQTGTGKKNEMNTYVQAITQVGDTVFTGGDFKYVESAGGERVDQSYLAGYNVDSGELVRSFRPTFNGQIKALEALPNNRLAVGGEFTEVNGEKVNHFVILDATTGQIDRTWDLQIQRRNGDAVQVKTLLVQDGYLYIGGNFTHVKGNTSSAYAYARGAARIKLSNGAVDWNWRPNFNGTVNGITAASDNSTVHAAGYFTELNNQRAFRLAALNGSDASNIKWEWEPSLKLNITDRIVYAFQFDVQDAGSTVWTGGADHLIANYSKNGYGRISSSISKYGGDWQDLHLSGNTIYGACHCGDVLFEGSTGYHTYWKESKAVHRMRLVAAFDKDSGEVVGEFSPVLKGASGYGVWESFMDSRGNLWVGGDINRSLGANGEQRTVGFARFASRDVTAPSTPSNLSVQRDGSTDKLSWSGVRESGARYQVLRDDRVIATVSGTSYEVEHTDGARYYVRSIDASENFSASTGAAQA